MRCDARATQSCLHGDDDAEKETSMHDLAKLPGTGDVARSLKPPLTEAQVNAILRRRPEIRPPVVAGRRRWRPEDVAALEQHLQARRRST